MSHSSAEGRARAEGRGAAASRHAPLTEMLADLRAAEDREHVTLGELIHRLGRRGHAGAIFAPALLALSPVGMIPGMSMATGAVILCLAGQLALGRRRIWLPRRAASLSIGAQPLNAALDWMQPKLCWLDRAFRPRLRALSRGPADRLVALAMIVLALLMYPLAFVPFGVAMPSAAIGLLSLGLAVGDGLVVAGGLAGAAAAAAGSAWALAGLF